MWVPEACFVQIGFWMDWLSCAMFVSQISIVVKIKYMFVHSRYIWAYVRTFDACYCMSCASITFSFTKWIKWNQLIKIHFQLLDYSQDIVRKVKFSDLTNPFSSRNHINQIKTTHTHTERKKKNTTWTFYCRHLFWKNAIIFQIIYVTLRHST